MQQRRPVRRALLSVSDKTGIIEPTQTFSTRGVELLSTGGIARLLAEKGLPVTEVSDYTGFSEVTDGHMKTLHPKVHGGILGRHDQGDGIMEQHGITPIDMVVVSLYLFAETITREDYSLEDAVENIDIGGPTMVRSAAKDHKGVAIVMKSSDYNATIEEMDVNEGSLTLETRFNLAIKASEHTAAYDSMIASYFGSMAPTYHGRGKEAAGRLPRTLNLNFTKGQDMRYGESSHQQAAFYIEENAKEASVTTAQQIQSKTLSYSNATDTNATLECMKEFSEPACVIVRHANPCDVAVSISIFDAYDRAYKTDPTSAFGGTIAFNHGLNAEAAQAIISRQFMKVIIVPSATEGTLKITVVKQNVRVLTCGQWAQRVSGLDFKHVSGGLLVQNRDLGVVNEGELRVVSKRQPTEQELRDALFCWKVTRFVKSDVIVYTKENMTVGIGAGQVSRVYSAKIAGVRAADGGLEVKGSAMVSDAFLPFRDDIDAATAVGVSCAIQPDDSIRGDEVIAVAGEHGIAMIFTDMRHSRH